MDLKVCALINARSHYGPPKGEGTNNPYGRDPAIRTLYEGPHSGEFWGPREAVTLEKISDIHPCLTPDFLYLCISATTYSPSDDDLLDRLNHCAMSDIAPATVMCGAVLTTPNSHLTPYTLKTPTEKAQWR